MNLPLINIYNNKRKLFLFCRNDKGELSITTDNTFFPYFYERDDIDGKFKAYTGESLRKVFVSEPSNVPKKRSDKAMEADVIFTRRYMIDKIDKLEKCPIKYAFIDIEVIADELPNVKLANKTISCISIYNSVYKSIQTFYLPDYESEYKLLEHFINYMRKEKFDLWLSWNVKFDYNYLYNRIPDFAEKISSIGMTRYGDGDVFYPAGISIVDYLTWFKKITLNREQSYALDNIAQTQLKEKAYEKIDFGKISPKIKEKNRNDIQRMVKLEEKFKLIDYFDEIRRLSKVDWEDMLWNSRVLDMLLLQEAKNQNVILPMKPEETRGTLEEKSDFEGAYRDALQVGRFTDGVGKYDLASCYPAMIIDFCLDPANIKSYEFTKNNDYINSNSKTLVLKEPPSEKDIIRPLDLSKILTIEKTDFIQNSNALLPTVVKKLMTLKNEVKANLNKLKPNTLEYKDMKQKYDAIKTIVNSAYGVFGNRFFRLYNKNVASATTYLVRDLLHYVQDKLEAQGHEIIYVDTDGIMINNNKEDISDILNKYVKEWAKVKYGKEQLTTEFGYEGYFKNLIILTKCRYEGELVTSKGTELERKGIEAKRKDSTKFMKEFQTTLLKKIRYIEPKSAIITWIKQEIIALKNQPLMNISFPCKLSRKPEDYKNVPIFLRALNNSELKKRVGEPFYYIFIKPEGYETKIEDKTIIQTYDKNGDKKGFKNLTTIRLTKACEKIGINYGDRIRYAKKMDCLDDEYEQIQNELIEKGLFKTEEVEVKGKAKDVIAFDEDTAEKIKGKVDYKKMIERNITMKLVTIFEAMKWDINEVTNG